jgi:glycosyltransferase involved in cell wall biosynthesis
MISPYIPTESLSNGSANPPDEVGSSPRVSVVIPNYNHERYLRQRIDSVLGQTFSDIEVIILDDASTDGSQSIIRDYLGRKCVRYVASSVNSGNPFFQWNRGVREAVGKYVWIAESDDYADSRFLETMVACLDRHPNAGLAYCDSFRVDENGKVGGTYKEYYGKIDATHWQCDFMADGRDEIRRYLLIKNTIPNASGVLFRKTCYDSVGGAPENLRLCGDWLTWIKILLVSDLAYVAEPRNYFRCHGGNVRAASGDFVLQREQYSILKYIHENLVLEQRQLRRVLDYIASAWACSLLNQCGPRAWRESRSVYRTAKLLDDHPLARLTRALCLHYPWKLWNALRSFRS